MQHLASAHVGLLGPEASSEAVAGLEIVDIESKLKAAALDSLPVYLRAQPTMYLLLEVEDKAAKDASAFTDRMPLWMSSKAVGGHLLPPWWT